MFTQGTSLDGVSGVVSQQNAADALSSMTLWTLRHTDDAPAS